jgi:hypothetical protein
MSFLWTVETSKLGDFLRFWLFLNIPRLDPVGALRLSWSSVIEIVGGQCGRKKHGFPYYILLLYIYLGNHQSRIWSWTSSDRFWDRMWNSRLRAEFSPEKIVSLGIFTTQADSTQKSQNYENQMPKGIKRLWVWPEAFAKVDWKFQHLKLAPQVFSPVSRVFSPELVFMKSSRFARIDFEHALNWMHEFQVLVSKFVGQTKNS